MPEGAYDYPALGAELRASLDRYARDRVETGGMLRAALENDLEGAVRRMHATLDLPALRDLTWYITNELPRPCHGSREAVRRWLAAGGDAADALLPNEGPPAAGSDRWLPNVHPELRMGAALQAVAAGLSGKYVPATPALVADLAAAIAGGHGEALIAEMVRGGYVISPAGNAIKCLRCRMLSHHPEDVRRRYCGACHRFHEEALR